jgi:hypothetical protein
MYMRRRPPQDCSVEYAPSPHEAADRVLGMDFFLLFWGFNLWMIYALFAGVGENAKQIAKFTDRSMRKAYEAGTGIGIMINLMVWAAGGFGAAGVLLARPA